jgi:hypothetical protein
MSEATRWEYRILKEYIVDTWDHDRNKRALDELNVLGEQGWEVAGAWGR